MDAGNKYLRWVLKAAGAGALLSLLCKLLWQRRRIRQLEKYSCLEPKQSYFELIGTRA